MMKPHSLVLLTLLFVPLSLHALEIPAPQPRTFTAAVADVRVSAHLNPSRIVEGTVSVTVPSILFSPPLQIPDARTAPGYGRPEIDLMVAATRASIEGTPEEILSFWARSDRAKKRELVENPAFAERSRRYFADYPGLTILGIFFLDKTTAVLTRSPSSDRVDSAALIRDGGRLFLTDAPDDDLELAILEAAFDPGSGPYFLYQMTTGEVVRVVMGQKGERLQRLANPVFTRMGEGGEAVTIPTEPKDPLWQDLPDGAYKTIAFGTTYHVRGSRIERVTDASGRDVTKGH